jgi:hypothetical protein
VRRESQGAKTKSPFFLRIGSSSIPKCLSKFHHPWKLIHLYQKFNFIAISGWSQGRKQKAVGSKQWAEGGKWKTPGGKQ